MYLNEEEVEQQEEEEEETPDFSNMEMDEEHDLPGFVSHYWDGKVPEPTGKVV